MEDEGNKMSTLKGEVCHDNLTNGPNADEVFEFMVKKLNGRGSPEQIVKESGLFATGFDAVSWFRSMGDRFICIERQSQMELVLVYRFEATYCIHYITKRSCRDNECKRFHVCKFMICGNCRYGNKCILSHDFLDERNARVARDIGFGDVFTNNEICSILHVRFPHVCPNWIEQRSCSEAGCIDLHMCPKYLWTDCNAGDSCEFSHNQLSEHNGPLVRAYKMDECNIYHFRKSIYFHKKDTGMGAVNKNIITRSHFKSETDPDEDLAICEAELLCECTFQPCKYLHNKMKLPYLWQIKFSGQWFTIQQTEEVERDFCDIKDNSYIITEISKGVEYGVLVSFKPVLLAEISNMMTNASQQVLVRRLSTSSYTEGSKTAELFKTQWRWYWQNDIKEWQRFEPDSLQQTLEIKFIAKQAHYEYWRDNYRVKFSIDFSAMFQTNQDDGKMTAIARRPVFVSSNDVPNRHHPDRLLSAPMTETILPDDWVPLDLAHPFELVRLSNSSAEFVKVTKGFYKTLDPKKYKIEKVFRLQNHKLWTKFKNREQMMEANFFTSRDTDVSLTRRDLFYSIGGYNEVIKICIDNIDNRVLDKNASQYGDGAHFARDAMYCHSYTKPPLRMMFLVKVLAVQNTKGDKSSNWDPNKPEDIYEYFDSCVDDEPNPSIFVVLDKSRYYPEFLIQYTCISEDEPTRNVVL